MGAVNKYGGASTKAVNSETRKILRTLQQTFLTHSKLMAKVGDSTSQRALESIARRIESVMRGGYEVALEQLAEAEAKLEKIESE